MSVVRLVRGGSAVVVDPADGGRLTSWVIDGRELLGGADATPEGHGCYPMVPWAGRVRDGRCRLLGRDVALVPQAADPHALHGFGHRSAWAVLEAGGADVRLALDLGGASGRAAGWPFGGRVEQHVGLGADGAVRLHIAVRAAAGDVPVVAGWHPWFPRRLDGVEGHVDLRAGGMLHRGADGLPRGEVVAPPAGPWDDCFVDVATPVRVVWPGVGAVEVDGDVPTWVVFDGQPLGLCVEPQSAGPDAFNLGGFDVVPAGGTWSVGSTLRWVPA